jgi:hypothetical protein
MYLDIKILSEVSRLRLALLAGGFAGGKYWV